MMFIRIWLHDTVLLWLALFMIFQTSSAAFFDKPYGLTGQPQYVPRFAPYYRSPHRSKAFKRRLDRIGWGLVKRDMPEYTQAETLPGIDEEFIDIPQMNNEQEMSDRGNWNGVDKRYMSYIGRGLVRRKRSVENQEGALNRVKRGTGSDSDADVSETTNRDKRALDRLSYGLIKKDASHPNDHISEAMADLDEVDKRYMDRLSMGLIKKDDESVDKRRYMDRIGMSLIKRDEFEPDKRLMDRIGTKLIKRNDDPFNSEKRYFDRLGYGLVKRNEFEKRYMDRLGMGLVKRDDENVDDGAEERSEEKRYYREGLDRIGYGLVKKDTDMGDNDGYQTSKRYLDRIGSQFVKKGLDRIGYGLIKREDNSGVKSVDADALQHAQNHGNAHQPEKKALDRLSYGLIKKSSNSNTDSMNPKGSVDSFVGGLQRRRMDRIGYGLVKRDKGSKPSASSAM